MQDSNSVLNENILELTNKFKGKYKLEYKDKSGIKIGVKISIIPIRLFPAGADPCRRTRGVRSCGPETAHAGRPAACPARRRTASEPPEVRQCKAEFS